MQARLKSSAAAVALLTTSQAFAGGLWLNEFGDFAAGRATAGAVAGTDEAASIIHNPAGAGLIEGSQLFLSAGYISPSVEFDLEESRPLVGNGDGGAAANPAPGAAFAYVHDLGSDKWSLGTSLGGLSGAGLDYDDEWAGRYQATDVNIILMALSVTVAYNITDKLTVGISPQYYYSELELDVNLPGIIGPGTEDRRLELDGDDTGFGFRAGLIYEWSEATRFGVAYQSKLDVDYDGDLKVRAGNPDIPVGTEANSDTELTMAQTVRAGVHHDLNDRLGLDLTVGWDDWSALDNVFVSVDGVGGAGLQKNWEDTYHYAAGFQYKLNGDWDITAGIAYDTNPVDAEDRTADLPVDRQVRYNVGTRYAYSDTIVLGGIFNYTDLGSARIDAPLWSGDYGKNELVQFSIFVNWKL